jgi:sugar phosphate permease
LYIYCFDTRIHTYANFSLWYKRDEIATRIALFIGCGALAGTFGGLIAYGVSHIHSTLSDWRILFLIEGLPSVALSVIVFFCLPDRPETSKYLTEDERVLANTRLNMYVGPSEGPRSFDMRSLNRALTDYKNWMICGMYLGLNLTLGSISGFLPTIITTLGYSSVNAQLYTVPPYAVAVVYMAVISFLSDRFKIRGFFVFFDAMVAVIGFAILIGVQKNQAVRYFAVFLIVAPTFTNIPLCLSWASNNNATESSKAVALGLVNSIGQCFSILASFSFPSSQGPLYIQGMALNLAFSIFTGLLALALFIILKMENKRRDSIEGPPPENLSFIDTAQLFDKAPGFRYLP